MDGPILRAEPRTIIGKQVKQLRRAGKIPGVVYGPLLKETIQVQVERRDLERFYVALGHSTMFTLRWDGGEQPVYIREVQVDPVRHTPLHVDFFAPNMQELLSVSVPITFAGGDFSGALVLTTNRTELAVRGLPSELPHQFDVDLSGLQAAGDSLRASDIALPRGVTLEIAEDEVIASVTAMAAEAVEEVPVTDEEAAAGEAAAAGAPTTEATTTTDES